MPKPNENESMEDFMQRCMGDDEANSSFPETDQRYAFCNSQWARMHGKKELAEKLAESIIEAINSKGNPYRDESGRFASADNDTGGGGEGGGSNTKGNPYHDASGRFTSGDEDGGSGGSDSGGNQGIRDTTISWGDDIAQLPARHQINNNVIEANGKDDYIVPAINQYAHKFPTVGDTTRVVASPGEMHEQRKLESELWADENTRMDSNRDSSSGYRHAQERVREAIDGGRQGQYERAISMDERQQRVAKAAVSRMVRITDPTKATYGGMAWENENFHGLAALYHNHAAVLLKNEKLGKKSEDDIETKGNPYRDENGRFTTEDNDAGGAGGVSDARGLVSAVTSTLSNIGIPVRTDIPVSVSTELSVETMNKLNDQISNISKEYNLNKLVRTDVPAIVAFSISGNPGVSWATELDQTNNPNQLAHASHITFGTGYSRWGVAIDEDKKDLYSVTKTMGELIAGNYIGSGGNKFWKEVKELHQEYSEKREAGKISDRNNMGDNANSDSYASFAREGFAAYQLNKSPNLYSRKVGELYDKHFGKGKKSDARVINNDQKNIDMKNETTPKTHDELLVIGRKKIATHYKVKDNPDTGTKDVDFTKRTVAAIANTYLWFDSDQDVLMPGSAAKTISERGPKSKAGVKIKNVKDHVISDRIGVIQVLDERKIDGKDVIYGESKMLKTTLGNDMLIEYQEGAIDQHSIGFKYNDIQLVTADDKDWSMMLKRLINPKDAEAAGYMFVVKDFTKFEYSPVSFGANVLTPYLGVKSDNKEAMQLKVFERLDLLNKQLRNGRQSDETMMDYELEILQLKQIISELFTEEPSIKATLLAERRQNKDTEQPDKENPKEVKDEVEDEKTKCIVICPGCQKDFDWLSIEESGMGYVKCPSCTQPVTQEGKKWYDLVKVIKETKFI